MSERKSPPPVKDDIAIQHRPENADSRHSAMREGRANRHGRREAAGPQPDPTEVSAATGGRVRPRTGEAGFAGPIPEDARIQRIQKLADLLDTRFTIPVINWPIGLDGLIGLIPGVGDTVTGAMSAYLVYEAHKAGARKRTLARMAWNVGVDSVLGLIPLVGDIFDIAHKANAKNARLLLEELRRDQADLQGRAAERR